MNRTMQVLVAAVLARALPLSIYGGHTLIWRTDSHGQRGVTNGVFSNVPTPAVNICRTRAHLRKLLAASGLSLNVSRRTDAQILWSRGHLVKAHGETSENVISVARQAMKAVPGLETGVVSLSIDPSGGANVSSVSPRIDFEKFAELGELDCHSIADQLINIQDSGTPRINGAWPDKVDVPIQVVGGSVTEVASTISMAAEACQVQFLGGFPVNAHYFAGVSGSPDNVAQFLATLWSRDVVEIPASAVFVRT